MVPPIPSMAPPPLPTMPSPPLTMTPPSTNNVPIQTNSDPNNLDKDQMMQMMMQQQAQIQKMMSAMGVNPSMMGQHQGENQFPNQGGLWEQ